MGGVALKQSSNIRWLSLVYLLESISRSFDVLKRISQLKQKQFAIDLDIVDGLIRLLLPFKNVISCIQTNNVPSLHNVLISIFTLRKALYIYTSYTFGENMTAGLAGTGLEKM